MESGRVCDAACDLRTGTAKIEVRGRDRRAEGRSFVVKKMTGASLVAAGAIGMGALATAGAGIAAAAHPGGTINGCVAKSDGTLRIVGSTASCSSKEKGLSFNARGPKGATGATGPQGPAGPQGPKGDPGDGGTSTSPTTFQMYANVDAEGDLGSNVDAVKAIVAKPETGVYIVTFDKPIGSCSATAQPGEAGGTDEPYQLASTATYVKGQPDEWELAFFNAFTNEFQATPFMVTVTCKS
jgi:hypothetical protein